MAFRIDEDPMRARERIRLRRQRNAEFLDMPVGGIEPADIGAAVGRVPDLALGIAAGIVAGDIEARQFVFGDDHLGLPSHRPRLHDEIRVLRVRARATEAEPVGELRFLLGRQAPGIADVDQRRAGAVGHAEDDSGPAGSRHSGCGRSADIRGRNCNRPSASSSPRRCRAGSAAIPSPESCAAICWERRQEFARRHADTA